MPEFSQVDWRATLYHKQVLDALIEIKDAIEKTSTKADTEFKRVGESVDNTSKLLTKGNLAVVALGAAFVKMAQQAISAIQEISAEAVNLNAEMETNELIFTNMFGDRELALQFLGETRQKAADLAISFSDVARFAKAVLPDTKNIEQFNELMRLAAVASRDANLPLRELIFSFNEAVSGDFISIRDRLDIPREVIKNIKDGAESVGLVQSIIENLNELFEKRGVNDIEKFADTFAFQMAAVAAKTDILKLALGDPVFEEFKQVIADVVTVLTEKEDDFSILAFAIGQIVASIVEFIGTNFVGFLQSIDTSQAMELVRSFQLLIENGRLLLDVIFGLQGDLNKTNSVLDFTQWLIDGLTQAMHTLSQTVAISKSFFVAFGNQALKSVSEVGYQLGIIGEEVRDYYKNADFDEDFKKSMETSLSAFEAFEARTKSQTDQLEEYKAAIEEGTDAGRSFEDTLLAQRIEAEEAEDALLKYEEAMNKIIEASEKLELKRQRKLEDANITAIRKRLDMELDFVRQREDLADKNVKRLIEIEAKFDKKRKELTKDLNDEEAEVYKDYANDKVEVDKDLATKRLNVEKDYRRALEDIRIKFEAGAEEFIRRRDAIQYLALVRQTAREEDEAKKKRARDLADAKSAASEKRAELKKELDKELEDFRKAKADKIRELEDAYDEEIEKADNKRLDEEDKQNKSEDRKREDYKTWLLRKGEDYQKWLQREKDDLAKSLADEMRIREEYEKSITSIMSDELDIRKSDLVDFIADAKEDLKELKEAFEDTWAESEGPQKDRRKGKVEKGKERASLEDKKRDRREEGSINKKRDKSKTYGGGLLSGYYASGGLLRSGEYGIVGEKGPELITTKKDARIFSNTQLNALLANRAALSPSGNPLLDSRMGLLRYMTEATRSKIGESDIESRLNNIDYSNADTKSMGQQMMFSPPPNVPSPIQNTEMYNELNLSLLPVDSLSAEQIEQIKQLIFTLLKKARNRQ